MKIAYKDADNVRLWIDPKKFPQFLRIHDQEQVTEYHLSGNAYVAKDSIYVEYMRSGAACVQNSSRKIN